jgi:hypothetical protein
MNLKNLKIHNLLNILLICTYEKFILNTLNTYQKYFDLLNWNKILLV